MDIHFIPRSHCIMILCRSIFIIVCNITSSTSRLWQWGIHILPYSISQHTHRLKDILDLRKLQYRVIPIYRKVNNQSCSTFSWNIALVLSRTGIGIIISTLCKIIVHVIFIHLLKMVDIPCTSLAMLCCAHGNNLYGYGVQVLKIWYLKPTKVHIFKSI